MSMIIDFRRRPPSTSRQLPSDMQGAIDQAVAAGMVRRIPRGESGLQQFVWDKRRGALVPRPETMTKRALRLAAAREKLNAERSAASTERMDFTLAAIKAGMSVADVAKALDVLPSTVLTYQAKLKEEGRL